MIKTKKNITITSRGLPATWLAFSEALTAVLAKLKDDDYLCLSVEGSERYVRFSLEWEFGMRLETTSNFFLDKEDRLDTRQINSLIAGGWNAPNWNPDEQIDDEEADLCPNYFMDLNSPIELEAVATLAVRVLAEVLLVPSPQQLQYFAFDGEELAIEFPELGIKMEDLSFDGDQEVVASQLLETLKETTGNKDLEFDEDGDIGIRFDTALVFSGVNLEGQFVTLFSLLLTSVQESPALFKRLNDINANEMLLRVYYRDDVVYAVADLPAMPFVGTHVAEAFGYFCDAANRLGIMLKADFGGDTAFGNNDPSPMIH